MAKDLKARVTALYTGDSPGAVRFRYTMILFDLLTVLFFIISTPLEPGPYRPVVNAVLFVVILADFLCRLWISERPGRYLRQVYVMADIAVLGSLILNPFVGINLAFLRILRGLRLGHSEYLLRDLRRDFPFFARNEDPIVAALNLVVFLFATSAGVYTLYEQVGSGTAAYIDAIYFTVTTLTTTGYGDITPVTPMGKIISVLIMIVGVSLFLNLARAIFLPNKVHHSCETCGLTRHDPDAVHCKHCGTTVNIETSGFG